jgi:hypothetical protein
MTSPFPGMDPYVEQAHLWADFHDDLIGEIKRFLATVLPSRYVVRTDERSYVVLAEQEGKEEHLFIPDLGVTCTGHSPGGAPPEIRTAAADRTSQNAPVQMLALIEERYRENFIEIREVEPDERLVTCIEVLSPSNKRRGSEGQELYLRKRQALLLGAANLVEIDLLRKGQRMPMVTPWPDSPYYILVCRRKRAPYCTVWPASFQERLPVVPVPLDNPDPDISLDLQPMVDSIYARGRYHKSIDYSAPLTPPLSPAQDAWLKARLAALS